MPKGTTLTPGEIMDRGLAAKHPALLLEKYKSYQAKHKYRFLNCGHEWEVRPNHLDQGRGCGACYYDQGPTYVYFMEHDGFDAFKVGATAVEHKQKDGRIRKDKRIRELEYAGWEYIYKVRYETRAAALEVEKAIIDSWRERGFPAALTEDQIRTGCLETVSRQSVKVHEILARLN